MAAKTTKRVTRAKSTEKPAEVDPTTPTLITNISDDLLLIGESYLFPSQQRIVTRIEADAAKEKHGAKLRIK